MIAVKVSKYTSRCPLNAFGLFAEEEVVLLIEQPAAEEGGRVHNNYTFKMMIMMTPWIASRSLSHAATYFSKLNTERLNAEPSSSAAGQPAY